MDQRPEPVRAFTVDSLTTEVYASRQEMGVAAAYDVAERMRALMDEQEYVRMVFAAAPSQNEFLATLAYTPDLDWQRVQAFHMDEYLGLPFKAPQRFGNFLSEHLFGLVKPGFVYYLDGNAPDPQAECRRYAALLQEKPIDIVCAGIGENGHMAFNDPPVADFNDPEIVKLVQLDETCRIQQVHDGAFPHLDDVPTTALTMTMPALMSGRWLFCMVPGLTKTEAVTRTLHGPITTACPATIMRHHVQAVLYLDRQSAAGL